LRRCRAADWQAVAALLGSAYPGANGVRPFAPHGTVDEWQEYVHQLVGEAGCGTIMPDGCYVVPAGLDRVSGVVLLTRLGEATAHIAQLAVDPRAQRLGLGRVLVSAACASAADAGCKRITLLVEGRNVPARRLYEALGFGAVARFVSAGNGHPGY
jgi:ribosomal protein S18 acetylase RimI-like enzyme